MTLIRIYDLSELHIYLTNYEMFAGKISNICLKFEVNNLSLIKLKWNLGNLKMSLINLNLNLINLK